MLIQNTCNLYITKFKYTAHTINCGKPRAAVVLKELSEKAAELGMILYAAGETAEMLPGENLGGSAFDDVEGVIALGGDGTMLTAVRELQGLNKPLIDPYLGIAQGLQPRHQKVLHLCEAAVPPESRSK